MEQTIDTYLPSCRYCGQMLETGQVAFQSQEDADEFATLHCDCPPSKAYQFDQRASGRRAEDLEQARSILDDMFSAAPDSPLVNVSEKIADTIYLIVVAVYDDEILNCTLQIDDCTKLKICKTSKGAIRITKHSSSVQNREV